MNINREDLGLSPGYSGVKGKREEHPAKEKWEGASTEVKRRSGVCVLEDKEREVVSWSRSCPWIKIRIDHYIWQQRGHWEPWKEHFQWSGHKREWEKNWRPWRQFFGRVLLYRGVLSSREVRPRGCCCCFLMEDIMAWLRFQRDDLIGKRDCIGGKGRNLLVPCPKYIRGNRS